MIKKTIALALLVLSYNILLSQRPDKEFKHDKYFNFGFGANLISQNGIDEWLKTNNVNQLDKIFYYYSVGFGKKLNFGASSMKDGFGQVSFWFGD